MVRMPSASPGLSSVTKSIEVVWPSTMFKTMGGGTDGNLGQAAQAAKTLADQQIDAWEKWLAMWGPKE